MVVDDDAEIVDWFGTAKIVPEDITLGPNEVNLDEFVSLMLAKEYKDLGYVQISRAYCRVARPDVLNWPEVLAEKLNLDSDYYYKNEENNMLKRNWYELYCSTYTSDRQTNNSS
jgi:hypothetical protein